MDRAAIFNWLGRHGPGVVAEVLANIVLPTVIYALWHHQWGEVNALLASSIPPLLWSLGGFLRNRRVDALSILVMIGIALSLLAVLGGGSPRLLLLREKTVTLLISLAFLGSVAIGKPLIYPLARATIARKSQEEADAFEAKRDHQAVRRTVTIMTLVWGFGLLADVVVSVALIFSISTAHYLVAGPILFYATMGALTLWTILYRRHRERSVIL